MMCTSPQARDEHTYTYDRDQHHDHCVGHTCYDPHEIDSAHRPPARDRGTGDDWNCCSRVTHHDQYYTYVTDASYSSLAVKNIYIRSGAREGGARGCTRGTTYEQPRKTVTMRTMASVTVIPGLRRDIRLASILYGCTTKPPHTRTPMPDDGR